MSSKTVKGMLGSNLPRGGKEITIFIPDKDRAGNPIDQDRWTDETLGILGRLFRGATAFPPGKGIWRDDSRGGVLLKEITVMVVSFVPEREFLRHYGALREFLHRFGREANQGEVGVVVGGDYYGISKFDKTD